jgi:HEAT repeat protein
LATAISKYYFYLRKENQSKKYATLKESLINVVNQKQALNDTILKRCNESMTTLLTVINEMDEEVKSPNWQDIRQTIITKVVLPNARKLSDSKKWFKRYMATQCFNLGKEEGDDSYISQLIKDKVLLVSLNAAEVAVKNPSDELIQSIISTYSQARKIQNATFAKILSNSESNMTPLILNRIIKAEDPYERVFCYRVLSDLPPQKEISPFASSDVHDPNMNLQIATMHYLAHNNAENIENILIENLDNDKWQVRAAAVKLLGQLKSTKSINLISTKLKDSEWWVRINAAQALAELGNKGLAVLKSFDKDSDFFASETAAHVLSSINIKSEKNE